MGSLFIYLIFSLRDSKWGGEREGDDDERREEARLKPERGNKRKKKKIYKMNPKPLSFA